MEVLRQLMAGKGQCGLNWRLFGNILNSRGWRKAHSHDPFSRIRFLLIPKIESCEHIENDLPTHGSVILKKRMEIEHALFSSDTLLEIWKAPTNLHGIPVIVLAPNWRFFVSSENRIAWTHDKWPFDILTTKTEPWNLIVWTPTSNFRNQESVP